ncbi:MAG: bifunctional precorrin-2 dehydrogenase/sirohydrochlorin ferrochelatase [Chloroflexi bacterium]|nr:bifunctional precorrin-2 dehydrogenase/sirohydrochlorin ferrochelatase [Chloroflexota bacterium]
MPAYYPVYLNLQGHLCVVVGGGAVAEGKIGHLLDCGARVRVVAPEVTAAVADWSAQGKVEWVQRRYQVGDLAGAFLAIAGTDDTSVNKDVAWEAGRLNVLLNVVDVPSLCTFIAPAVVRWGPVTVAISTSGASPALARRLREEMQDAESCRCMAWADAAGLISDVRTQLRREGVQVDPEHWQRCLDSELLDMVRHGRSSQARERLLAMLKAGAAPS